MEGDHEKTWHRLFSNYRKTGEWFALDEEYLRLIAALNPSARIDSIALPVQGEKPVIQSLGDYLCEIGQHVSCQHTRELPQAKEDKQEECGASE